MREKEKPTQKGRFLTLYSVMMSCLKGPDTLDETLPGLKKFVEEHPDAKQILLYLISFDLNSADTICQTESLMPSSFMYPCR